MLAPTLDPTSRRIYEAEIPPQRVLADSGRLWRRQPGRCLKRPAVLALGTVCPPAPIYCASVRRVSVCAALSVRCSRARRPFGLSYSRSTYLPSSGSSFSTALSTASADCTKHMLCIYLSSSARCLGGFSITNPSAVTKLTRPPCSSRRRCP